MIGSLFLRGFLSNVFNPKSVLFFVSVFPTLVDAGPGTAPLPKQMAVFGILYVGIPTAVHGTIVILAARLPLWLVQGPRHQTVRRILAVLLRRNLAVVDNAPLTEVRKHATAHAA